MFIEEELEPFLGGSMYDYDSRAAMAEHMSLTKHEPEDAQINMDMLRKMLKDQERAERKIIGQDDPILEQPVPPLKEHKTMDPATMKKIAEKEIGAMEKILRSKDTSKDRFDLDDEDFLRQPKTMADFKFPSGQEKQQAPKKEKKERKEKKEKKQPKSADFPTKQDLDKLKEIRELASQEIDDTEKALERELDEFDLLNPTQLTPKEPTEKQKSQFHPSFQPVLKPESFQQAKPVVKGQQTQQQQPQAYYIPVVYQPFFGEMGSQMYYPQMMMPGQQWMTSPQQFSQMYGQTSPYRPMYAQVPTQ